MCVENRGSAKANQRLGPGVLSAPTEETSEAWSVRRCGRMEGVALAVDGCWHVSSGAATRTADSSVGAGSGSSLA